MLKSILVRIVNIPPKYGRWALYAIGSIMLLNGVSISIVYSVPSGLLLISAGLFAFPQVRGLIENLLDTDISPEVGIGVFCVLYFAAAIALVIQVDIAAEGPEMLAPYFE